MKKFSFSVTSEIFKHIELFRNIKVKNKMSYIEQTLCLENILNSNIELLNKNEVKIILHNKFRYEDLELRSYCGLNSLSLSGLLRMTHNFLNLSQWKELLKRNR